jgi:ABC-type antimicrobial peptide transport system permease subunit
LSLIVRGGLAGLAGALIVTRLIRVLLFRIPPYDPKTFAFVALLLVLVAAAAALPAHRATRVDPVAALRQD